MAKPAVLIQPVLWVDWDLEFVAGARYKPKYKISGPAGSSLKLRVVPQAGLFESWPAEGNALRRARQELTAASIKPKAVL